MKIFFLSCYDAGLETMPLQSDFFPMENLGAFHKVVPHKDCLGRWPGLIVEGVV